MEGTQRVRGRLRPLLDRTIVRFAGVAFLAVALVGGLLGFQLANDRRQAGLETAHARAVPTASMLRHELMEAGGPGEPSTEERYEELDRRFRRHTEPAGISDVNVWSVDGALLFSTVRDAVGTEAPEKAADLEEVVVAGAPSSEVADMGEGHAPHHVLDGAVFRTYAPASMEGQAGPAAVIEIVQDYAPTEAAVASGLRRLAGTLGAGLVVLYLLLLPIAARMSRRLRDLLDRERETVRRLEEADASKNLFLQAISHELRTPLTVVSGLAATMQEHEQRLEPHERAHMLERLADNSSRLEGLLTDLLDVDRLGRGVVSANRRTIRLRDLVDRTLEHLGGAATISVDVRVSTANVDPAQVERILENLVVNARKYAGPDARVWIRARALRDGFLLLAVEDDGPGVPDDMKERIFDPFERGSGASDHAPGTGIGLGLVGSFAQLHGGRAWVQDRPSGGASFRVVLADAAPEPEGDQRSSRRRSEDMRGVARRGRRRKGAGRSRARRSPVPT